MTLSCSQLGTRAEGQGAVELGSGWGEPSRQGGHMGRQAAVNPSRVLDNRALSHTVRAEQVWARCKMSSAWGQSDCRARRGGGHLPLPQAGGCRHSLASQATGVAPVDMELLMGLVSHSHHLVKPHLHLHSHPVLLEVTMICPFRDWGPYRSMGKSPRTLSPTNQSTGRTCRIAHSHYSFHQRLVSNPACTEEMMRVGGGCRKTFAGGRIQGTK